MSKIADATESLLRAMSGKAKGDKPEGATTTYTVQWCVRSDSFDSLGMRVSSSPTPRRLDRSKTFVSKDKADKLYNDLLAAFKVLNYELEAWVYIEEGWFE